ncbi:pectinesterase [Seiridium cupressi]|uniref:Pectinesterase n=1 Tax=Seiridium unicorne TaxID=138068 RepID=A0ABR2UKP5_9PEZI
MKSIIVSLGLVASAVATSRTSAPSGCITVATSGGDYDSVQDAVDSLSTTSTDDQCIFLDQGTYSEQVLVSARDAQLTIYGYTTDTSSYSGNKATITASYSQADGLTDDETGTLRVKAADFKLYNVNVANTYGSGSQAIALSAYEDSGYYGVQITGFQDTVLAQTGYQVYANSLIEGATDFIFGQNSPAWFENVDLRVLSASVGYVTANGRSSSTGTSYYVFNNCDIAAASGNTVTDGAYYLGRPWGEYARVVFQNTAMSSVINSAGWSVWSTSDANTDDVTFGEYDNSGDGSEGTRASFATKLSSAVSISTILGSSYSSAGYYDSSYF